MSCQLLPYCTPGRMQCFLQFRSDFKDATRDVTTSLARSPCSTAAPLPMLYTLLRGSYAAHGDSWMSLVP